MLPREEQTPDPDDIERTLGVWIKSAVKAKGSNTIHARNLLALLKEKKIDPSDFFSKTEDLLKRRVPELDQLFHQVNKAHDNARARGAPVPDIDQDKMISDMRKTIREVLTML